MKKFLPFLMILSLMLSLTACGTAQSGSEAGVHRTEPGGIVCSSGSGDP